MWKIKKKNLHIKLALWFDQSLCKLWSDPSKTKEALDNIDSQLQALKVVLKERLLPMEVPILSPGQQKGMVLQGDLNHQCTGKIMFKKIIFYLSTYKYI